MRKIVTEEMKKEMIEMYKSGMYQHQIADHMGLSTMTVGRHIRAGFESGDVVDKFHKNHVTDIDVFKPVKKEEEPPKLTMILRNTVSTYHSVGSGKEYIVDSREKTVAYQVGDNLICLTSEEVHNEIERLKTLVEDLEALYSHLQKIKVGATGI